MAISHSRVEFQIGERLGEYHHRNSDELLISGLRTIHARTRNLLSGEIDIEGVDFLGASIAQDQRGVVRSQSNPGPPKNPRPPDVLQACYLFDAGVSDAKTTEPRRALPGAKVYIP
jgi:hypothetical protein